MALKQFKISTLQRECSFRIQICINTNLEKTVPVAGVLDEPYSQLRPLSGVAVQPASLPCPSYVARRAGMANPLSGHS